MFEVFWFPIYVKSITSELNSSFFLLSLCKNVLFKPTSSESWQKFLIKQRKKLEEGPGAGQTKIQMSATYIAEGGSSKMDKGVGTKK